MSLLKITIDGKPVDLSEFGKGIHDVVLEAAIQSVTSQVKDALTPDEFAQIALNFRGTIDDFKVVIDGHDELIEKASNALSD